MEKLLENVEKCDILYKEFENNKSLRNNMPKRTYQPHKRQRKVEHGFMKGMRLRMDVRCWHAVA